MPARIDGDFNPFLFNSPEISLENSFVDNPPFCWLFFLSSVCTLIDVSSAMSLTFSFVMIFFAVACLACSLVVNDELLSFKVRAAFPSGKVRLLAFWYIPEQLLPSIHSHNGSSRVIFSRMCDFFTSMVSTA